MASITNTSYSQEHIATRYKDVISTQVQVSKDISYAVNIPAGSKEKYYRFDLYQPASDSMQVTNRPLIIWMHGGGFKFGSKNTDEVEAWCNYFAQRGYVAAALNYRLSKKNTLFNFKDLVSGAADAVADAREAIVYFKVHAKEYGIDPNRIILGGNSAGAIVALQTAYSTPSQLALLAKDTMIDTPAVTTGKIAAVINFWGALFNIEWLNSATVPIVSVHGRNDKTVPANQKGESFFGSIPIHQKADELHIPNAVKIYDDYAHELDKHFNPLFSSEPARQRRLEAAQFAIDFLYKELVLGSSH